MSSTLAGQERKEEGQRQVLYPQRRDNTPENWKKTETESESHGKLGNHTKVSESEETAQTREERLFEQLGIEQRATVYLSNLYYIYITVANAMQPSRLV